jgi:hypothetical protein
MSSSFAQVGVMKYRTPVSDPSCNSPVTNRMNRMAYGKVAAKYTTLKRTYTLISVGENDVL